MLGPSGNQLVLFSRDETLGSDINCILVTYRVCSVRRFSKHPSCMKVMLLYWRYL